MSASDFAVPFIIVFIAVYGMIKRTDVYNEFVLGAAEGLKTAFDIIPRLLGLIVAVKAFSSSGASNFLVALVRPFANAIHFPAELLPFSLLRPISGSGSLAMATDIMKKYGADSFLARAVSVMMGSTETTFYTIAVYFGAVCVKDTRHTLLCALLADLVSAAVSVAVCKILF